MRQSFEVRTKLPKHRRVFTTNTETRVLIANLIHLIRHKQTPSIALFLRLCNEIQQTSAAQTAFAIKQPLFGYRYCALSCWASVCLSIFAALLISFVIHRISFDFLIPSYFLLKRCIYNLPHKLGEFQENNLEFTKCSHGLLRNCNSLKNYLACFLKDLIAETISTSLVVLDHSSQKSIVALRGFKLGGETLMRLGSRLASPTTKASPISSIGNISA